MKTIAIAGATGAVGMQMLECLKERNINVHIKLLASARSKGKVIDGHIVEELTEESFKDVDYVLGACENDVTKRWMPWAKKAGCIVVDNSSAFRLDEDTPLVVPEINAEDISKNNGVIANPNCSTIIALVACDALKKEFGIKRMIVTTMQAVSGAGVKGIHDLETQIIDPNAPKEAFPYQIAYNLIPQIGDFDDLGITKEEWKMQNEGRKIWHDQDLLVNCTCVRVPVLRSHSESITLECEKEVDVRLLLFQTYHTFSALHEKNEKYIHYANVYDNRLFFEKELTLFPLVLNLIFLKSFVQIFQYHAKVLRMHF